MNMSHLLYNGIESMVRISGVLYYAFRTVGIVQGVLSLHDISITVLPMGFMISSVVILDSVLEFVLRMSIMVIFMVVAIVFLAFVVQFFLMIMWSSMFRFHMIFMLCWKVITGGGGDGHKNQNARYLSIEKKTKTFQTELMSLHHTNCYLQHFFLVFECCSLNDHKWNNVSLAGIPAFIYRASVSNPQTN